MYASAMTPSLPLRAYVLYGWFLILILLNFHRMSILLSECLTIDKNFYIFSILSKVSRASIFCVFLLLSAAT